jgi:TorA maturation chaperone TorD
MSAVNGDHHHALEASGIRARFYALLALVYLRPPDRGFLESLVKTLSTFDGRTWSETLPQQIEDGIEQVKRCLTLRIESLEQGQASLSTEYTHLFRGVKPDESPPPPYESVYREGTCWGQSSAKVFAEYQGFGLTPRDGLEGEPPDHISFELDFMRFLCEREEEAWSRGDRQEALRLLDAEERFLSEHLSTWVTEFCENVRKHDTLGFYRGWANITEGWLSLDYQQIKASKAIWLLEGGPVQP